LEDEAAEPAIASEEVVLVAEAIRLPVERRVDRQPEGVADAVERDALLEGRARIELDGNVLKAELVRGSRTKHHLELGEALVDEPEIALRVDLCSGNARERARSRAGDEDVRARIPEARADFDVEALTGGGVVQRARPVLGRGGRGEGQHQRGGQSEPNVQTDRGVL